jgi:Winged helix-turn helix
MPRLSAAPITLTPEQEADLRGLARAHKTPRKLAERAEMILRSAAGTGVREIARQLGVWPKTVRHWRSRWLSGQAEAAAAARLADEPRPGAPATFTPEQVCAIVALALRTPGKERAAAQSLEPERTGPRGGQARHRRQHLARLGRALV